MLVVACPGQGAQKPGFLNSFLESPSFRETIEAAGHACGIDLVEHGTQSDEETIKDTAVAQPLLVASAIATFNEVFADDSLPQFVAGHSVGEIGAAVVAGILSAEDGMKFVNVRAQGMAEASNAQPTGMAAVVGGVAEDVISAIEEAGLAPANVNGGGQIVAAGSLEAIEKFAANPPERARVIPLKVAGAFHTDYMKSAQAPLADMAAGLEVQDPRISILSNRDGQTIQSGREYVDALVSQVTSPVRWDLCQATLVEAGVTGLIELAPGGTLTGLAKRSMKGVETLAIKSAEDLEGAREFVRTHA